jgi:hypothetical protein
MSKCLLLVGDNPFQGVSHVSRERAISRVHGLSDPDFAARLILTSAENGADGFMFTLNSITLSILSALSRKNTPPTLQLYALVPDINEFVRTVAFSGGITGLGKNLAREMLLSKNVRSILNAVAGGITLSHSRLFLSYLYYEAGRINRAVGKKVRLESLMLHETLCDMALALDMDWLFKTQFSFAAKTHTHPGFETRNLPYLVRKFEQWGLDVKKAVIAAPFNAVGFQMCPSQKEMEDTLSRIPDARVIGFSILAGGYLKPAAAIAYTKAHPELSGIAVGVSREEQARTFKSYKEALNQS